MSEWTTNCHNQTIFWPTIDGKPTSTAILLLLPTNRIYGVSFSIIVWLKAGLIHPMLLWWETTMGQLIWCCLISSPFLEKSSKWENISSLPIFLNNSRHVIFRKNKLFPGHWQSMAKWRKCWERICLGEKYHAVQYWWLFSKMDLTSSRIRWVFPHYKQQKRYHHSFSIDYLLLETNYGNS